jgi:hypothetical protein
MGHAPLKSGEILDVYNIDMIIPLVGNLIDVTVEGETVRARIMGVTGDVTKCKVVSDDVKD